MTAFLLGAYLVVGVACGMGLAGAAIQEGRDNVDVGLWWVVGLFGWPLLLVIGVVWCLGRGLRWVHER